MIFALLGDLQATLWWLSHAAHSWQAQSLYASHRATEWVLARRPEHHHPPNRPEDFERAVLVNVLTAHPGSLAIEALLREFEPEDQRRPCPDAVLVAVDRLESVGLILRDGDSLSPSAAAVYMGRLLGPTI
jgi:hypothetical protein